MKRAALLVLVACGHATPPPAPPPVDPFADDPVAVLAGLEERLTTARQVDVTVKAHTIGAFALELAGELHVERERVSWIKLRGEQDGAPVTAKWSSLTPFDPTVADTQPPTWADGLLIGVSRMGATHNLANVVGGSDPDTGHGDIGTWVEVADVAWKGDEPKTHALTFRIRVVGKDSGEAELTLDERGLPLRRDQLVHFAEGDLRVVEEYARFDVVP